MRGWRLATTMLSGANFLIFEEPTNHLDVESIEALEDAIESFGGTVLLVSHDRALLRTLTTRIWVLHGTRITDFDGGFDEWEVVSAEREHAAAVTAAEEVALRKVRERKATRRPEDERRRRPLGAADRRARRLRGGAPRRRARAPGAGATGTAGRPRALPHTRRRRPGPAARCGAGGGPRRAGCSLRGMGGGDMRHGGDRVSDARRGGACLGLLALAEVLGMSLWFSASAVSGQYRALWHLTPGEAGWLTTSVQLGFVVGNAGAAIRQPRRHHQFPGGTSPPALCSGRPPTRRSAGR